MTLKLFTSASLAAMTIATAAIAQPAPAATATPAAAPQPAANPLLGDWNTPDGVPPYDRIRPEHYRPAFDEALRQARLETGAIYKQRSAPTFANTIEALDSAGALLRRTSATFFNVAGADATPDNQRIQAEVSPLLTAYNSELTLNPLLFARVDAVYKQRDTLDLTPEQRRLLTETHRDFVRSGAALPEAARTRMAAIDQRLSALSVEFGQKLLAAQTAGAVTLTEAQVAGLSPAQRAAAAKRAAAAGTPGFIVTSSRSDVEPFLTVATDRGAREKVWRAFAMRGDGGANDTNPLIAEMLRLRLERAKLLGFRTHADFVLDDSMAKTPAAATGLLKQVFEPALKRAAEEEADLLKLARADGIAKIEPWDWRFYAERVRQQRFGFDEAAVKEYLPLDGMVKAMWDVTNRLFGLTAVERPDVPVYAPGVKVWEVRDRDGSKLGLFYADWFARDTKRPGAWMNSLRTQDGRTGALPIVVNNCNYVPPAEGQPALISKDDARTLFHEFGHGLHGLLSRTKYRTLAGTSVSRDFVEFPAQVYEHWIGEKSVLERFARNVRGEPMPPALLDGVKRAATFNQGFLTVQQLSSALVDQAVHSLAEIPADFDARAFEAAELKRLGVPEAVGMRHRLAHFSHLFDGGYSAAYYAYTWAEAMDADGFAAFEETGDIFNPALAAKLRTEVLERGNSRDPAESYIAFRGRLPTADALLKNRGLN